MKYKHFTIEEREKIQEMCWQRSPIREIARTLKRSPSSVSRELKRNFHLERKMYAPRVAHERAALNRQSRGRKDRLKNAKIREYVVSRIKKRWSPEQISGRMRIELGEKISHEAIYQYIYAQIHRKGWGYVRPGCEDLRPYLRRRRKRRMKKGLRKCRVFRPHGPSIDARPDIVEKRKRFGDWESDTVEGRNRLSMVNTLVERKTGYVFITRLQNKTGQATFQAIINRFKYLPENLKRTITFDNGTENSDWVEIEKNTGVSCFFAHPYHSWERGTNENTNGLFREYSIFQSKNDTEMNIAL